MQYKNPNQVLKQRRKLKLFFDIDDTITKWDDSRDYVNFEPNIKMVNSINKLYDLGHEITLFTSRGMTSCGPGKISTEIIPSLLSNLTKIGLKYDNLLTHKPVYDLLVDDKCTDPQSFLEYMENKID